MSEELSPCGLIFAYQLDGKGAGLALDLRACLAPGEPLLEGTHWLHFDGRHQGARLWLREESGLDSVAIDGLLGRKPRPRSR